MIVDSSAIVAILRGEAEAEPFTAAISSASVCRLSAASYLEIGIVIDKDNVPFASQRLDDFIIAADIVIEPVTESQARIAREAYGRYGRGNGHPARLNFGDCFAYALAKEKNEPLLFKGSDFGQTDIRIAG